MLEQESRKKRIFHFTILLFVAGLMLSCGTSESTEVYELTANATPAEGGTVNPVHAEYDEGTTVQIEAEPSEEFIFVRWEGDITGSDNPHSFEISDDVDVTAIFERKQYTLTVEIEGAGSVQEKIIQAPKQTDYEHGTVVELTAMPEQSRVFTGWDGDLESQDNPETIIVENELTVTAVFEWGSPDNEDCNSFDTENIEIEELGDDWRIVDGNAALLLFDDFEEAKNARDIIQFYEFSNLCYVERPQPPMVYLLADGAPVQKSNDTPFNEDCIEHNPENIKIEQSGSNWQVLDGNSLIFTYDNRSDAAKARDTIQFYGFTQQCFVGRPDPGIQYWLR